MNKLFGHLLCSVLLLSGCTSLPHFKGPGPVSDGQASVGVPKVKDIVDHIQCEMINFVNDPKNAPRFNGSSLYVASAQLTIEVTDDGSLNPSLSFIRPLSAASTNRTIGMRAQYDGQAHRLYTQTFAVVLDPLVSREHAQECADLTWKKQKGIKGDLGIDRVLAEGVQYADKAAFKLPVAGADSSDVSAQEFTTFGSTIDFTVTYGGGVDPDWTLVHFTGPGGGSSSLLDYTRTSKDTLLLSFAAVPVPAPKVSAPLVNETPDQTRVRVYQERSQQITPNVQKAEIAAEANIERMIFLNLLRSR